MSPTVEIFCDTHGGTPFFSSSEDYEDFRVSFGEKLRPELDKTREARRQSEEASRKHCIA